MAHGKPVSLDFAVTSIKDFIEQEVRQTTTPIEEIGVGHRFDLQLIKDFILEIDKLNLEGKGIDSIRFYHGLDDRNGNFPSKEYDLIIVPTLGNGDDLHKVYTIKAFEEIDPLILGESTPCPNVCHKKVLSCQSDSI